MTGGLLEALAGLIIGAVFEFLRDWLGDLRKESTQLELGQERTTNAALVEREKLRREADAVWADLDRDAGRQP